MNTVQDAIKYIRKRKLSYWQVKTTSGKLKGEYEGEDFDESVEEFADLTGHLITGKYELTVRNSKQNYRGATVFDFEVFNTGYNAPNQKTENTMDAQLMAILIDIKTGLARIEMKMEMQDKEQERKFKELGKALSEVFDEKEEPAQNPLDMIKGLKGLSDLKDLKM